MKVIAMVYTQKKIVQGKWAVGPKNGGRPHNSEPTLRFFL